MKSTHIGLKKGGFTLIELLVVIVIIGILASIAIATFSGFFMKARDADRKAAVVQVHTIMLASQVSADAPSYLDPNGDGTLATTATELRTEVTAELNAAGYTIPAEINSYDYFYGAVGTEFVIATCLEDDGSLFARGTSAAIADTECASGATVPSVIAAPGTDGLGTSGALTVDLNA